MDNRQDELSNNENQDIVIEENLKTGQKSEFNLLGNHKKVNSNIDIESQGDYINQDELRRMANQSELNTIPDHQDHS